MSRMGLEGRTINRIATDLYTTFTCAAYFSISTRSPLDVLKT
jgi:hypothetical protein